MRFCAKAGSAGDRAFDNRGHFLIDGVGCGAVPGGVHGEHRLVDLRQLAHFDAEEGGEAADDDERVDPDRHHGTADEEAGDAAALAVLLLLQRGHCGHRR